MGDLRRETGDLRQESRVKNQEPGARNQEGKRGCLWVKESLALFNRFGVTLMLTNTLHARLKLPLRDVLTRRHREY